MTDVEADRTTQLQHDSACVRSLSVDMQPAAAFAFGSCLACCCFKDNAVEVGLLLRPLGVKAVLTTKDNKADARTGEREDPHRKKERSGT